MSKLPFIIGVLVAFLLIPIKSLSASYITGCTYITSPGEYILTQDLLNLDVSPCINIQADNVILDCQGHILDSLGMPTGIKIVRFSPTTSNVTVKNCVLRRWHDGIYIYNSNYNTLINITPEYNYNGIYIYNSNYNTLSNITTYQNSYGIFLYYSDYTIMENLNITYTHEYGISLLNSNFNNLSNITFNYNNYGIRIENSNNNVIRDSVIKNSGSYGIRIISSQGNQIFNNIFNNTNNFYFYGDIYTNYWNTTLTQRTNIVGGPYIGGNYWGRPDGTGYSDTCSDSNNDGICDNPYTLATDNIDYLPLAKYTPPPTTTTTTTPTTTTTTTPTTTTTTIPQNITALALIPMLLGNPLFFAIVFGLALAASIEKKVNSGGIAFVLTFLGVLIMFSIFSGVVPLWFVLVLIAIIIGGAVYFSRRS
jgi:parallel beta-helix repeat protein